MYRVKDEVGDVLIREGVPDGGVDGDVGETAVAGSRSGISARYSMTGE